LDRTGKTNLLSARRGLNATSQAKTRVEKTKKGVGIIEKMFSQVLEVLLHGSIFRPEKGNLKIEQRFQK